MYEKTPLACRLPTYLTYRPSHLAEPPLPLAAALFILWMRLLPEERLHAAQVNKTALLAVVGRWPTASWQLVKGR